MARLRRRTCITFLALLLLVFLVTVVLKTFAPTEHAFDLPGAHELFPHIDGVEKGPVEGADKAPVEGADKADMKSEQTETDEAERDAKLEAMLKKFSPPNYNLHAFYYIWYGSPQFDGKYIHWDHPQLPHWDAKVAQAYPQGRHEPPDDIGANFYPVLGAYSSRDPAVMEAHMQQLRTAAIGKKIRRRRWCVCVCVYNSRPRLLSSGVFRVLRCDRRVLVPTRYGG